MYIVKYIDRYNNQKIVGAFDSLEKVLEVVKMIYKKENEEFPDDEFAKNYLSVGWFEEDWFDVGIYEVEVNKIYLN